MIKTSQTRMYGSWPTVMKRMFFGSKRMLKMTFNIFIILQFPAQEAIPSPPPGPMCFNLMGALDH